MTILGYILLIGAVGRNLLIVEGQFKPHCRIRKLHVWRLALGLALLSVTPSLAGCPGTKLPAAVRFGGL
jgi:hypothetical protein